MGLSPSGSAAASPGFLAAFRAEAGTRGVLGFAQFMRLALYHPEVGYYRKTQARIGYRPGTDFYTASTSGPIFGELVADACATLLRRAGRDPARHTFIEIGAETAGGVLAGVTHPFATVATRRLGDAIELRGDCVVFSNELFDAQPFMRTVFRAGAWREIAVAERDGMLAEIVLPEPLPLEPAVAPEGYCFDRPLESADLAAQLAAQPWQGVFVAFDYGKSYRELCEATPAGTARAYHRHAQSNDLLARAGEQDLTCHVCWDWIEAALQRHGFGQLALDSQESFLIRHAGERIAAISAADAARFSPRKLTLMQLLHPGQMGQKFQVLHGLR